MDLSKLRKIFGERVATSEAIRRQHSHDESLHVPISLPDAVIFPENTKEVSIILKFANDNKIPVIPFGAGTSLEGQVHALNGGITIWQWIEAYGGIAFIKNSNKRMQFDYESEIRLNILTDYFELFLPFYSSIGYELNQENYLSKVRFRISFDPKTLSSLISRRWF